MVSAQHRVHLLGTLLLHERSAGAVVATACPEANAGYDKKIDLSRSAQS
jgi:hypothetical protein